MRKKSEILDSIINGDNYSNSEALVMMEHFKSLADNCFELGDRFYTTFREAHDRYMELYKVCQLRGLTNKNNDDEKFNILQKYYNFIVKLQSTDGTIVGSKQIVLDYLTKLSQFYSLQKGTIKDVVLDNITFGNVTSTHKQLMSIVDGTLQIKYLKWDFFDEKHFKRYVTCVKGGMFYVIKKNDLSSETYFIEYKNTWNILKKFDIECSNKNTWNILKNFDIKQCPDLTINEAIHMIKNDGKTYI